MPSDSCPYSPRVAAQLADPAAHLDPELAGHLPSCAACRHAAAVAVRNWPTDRSPSPSLAEWLRDPAGNATVISPFQAEQLAGGRPAALELGPYLLLDRLGAGGMGEVYRGWHTLLRREDAVKTVRPELAGNPNAIRRFLREAEAVAKLRHPNVVHVYAADRAGAGYYLAMEYVPGTDLGKFARARGPIPVRLAAEFVRQAAEGLHHAFTHGLVHRDIKPGNLLLHVAGRKNEGGTTDGSTPDLPPFDVPAGGSPPDFAVKVADFGLARALVARDDASEMTAAGAVLGTTDYMAPEQAQNAHAADTRADVYSLGCTLYYLLTGAVPFPGGTPLEKMIRHATAAIPSPSAVRADVPAALDAVVRKSLAKRPDDRHQTPGELAAALLAVTRPEPPVVAAPGALGIPNPELVRGDTASWAPAGTTQNDTPGRKEPPAPRQPERNRRWVGLGVGLVALAVVVLVAVQMAGPRPEGGPKVGPPDPNPRPVVELDQVPLPRSTAAAPWAFVGPCWSARKDKLAAVGFLADGSVVGGRNGGDTPDGSDTGYWEVWPPAGGGKPLRAMRPDGTVDWEYPVHVHAASGVLVTNLFRRFDPVAFAPRKNLVTDLTKYGSGNATGIDGMNASGNGKYLVAGVTTDSTGEKKVRYAVQWKAETGTVTTASLVETNHDLSAIDTDDTGDTIAIGTCEGKVLTHTTSGTGARVWTAPNSSNGTPDPVSTIAITPNGKTIYSAHLADANVHVWSVVKNQRETTLPLGWQVSRLTVSPDGRWLVAAGYAVTVWDLKAEPPKAYDLAVSWAGELKAIAFTPDSKHLAVGGRSWRNKPEEGLGVAWLWELERAAPP